jgi:hypothetical protein
MERLPGFGRATPDLPYRWQAMDRPSVAPYCARTLCRIQTVGCPCTQHWLESKTMNRQKKIKQLLKAHAKKASAKLAPKRKSTYISKADRLKLAVEAAEPTPTSEN